MDTKTVIVGMGQIAGKPSSELAAGFGASAGRNKRSRSLIGRLLIGVVLLATALPAFAEKIGYVDARRLIDESTQGQASLKALEQEFAARNREIKGKFDLFKAKEAELQKNSVLLSPEDLEVRTNELREMQRELKRDQRDYNEEYNARRNQNLGGLQKTISEAVIFVAERDKYDLIVQQAVYASSGVNLTDVVLKELAKRAN